MSDHSYFLLREIENRIEADHPVVSVACDIYN